MGRPDGVSVMHTPLKLPSGEVVMSEVDIEFFKVYSLFDDYFIHIRSVRKEKGQFHASIVISGGSYEALLERMRHVLQKMFNRGYYLRRITKAVKDDIMRLYEVVLYFVRIN